MESKTEGNVQKHILTYDEYASAILPFEFKWGHITEITVTGVPENRKHIFEATGFKVVKTQGKFIELTLIADYSSLKPQTRPNAKK